MGLQRHEWETLGLWVVMILMVVVFVFLCILAWHLYFGPECGTVEGWLCKPVPGGPDQQYAKFNPPEETP